MTFAIDDRLRDLLSALALTPGDAGGSIEFIGEDPIVPSKHRLGAMSALTLMANAVAASALHRLRSGEGQDLSIDLRDSVFSVGQTSFGIHAFRPTLNGYSFPDDRDSPNPLRSKTEFHELADGRWGSLNGHFRHMLFGWLELLKCTPAPESIIAAVKKWKSTDLEAAAVEHGLAFSLCLTRDEWGQLEQGTIQKNKPLIDIRKIGESAPEPIPSAARPLAGVRVLGVTHAIAGAVVGRTLAEQGAEVLYLHSPNQIEHDSVYDSANVGTGSAFLDLKTPEGKKKAREAVASADIFVENQRGGAVARLGLSDEELMELRPGIIIVTVRCFGDEGPWAERPGNDRQGTAASGLSISEGSFELPRLPPSGTTNDYMVGVQGAAGATAALIRRVKEGGSYHVAVSLVRNAMWLDELGTLDEEESRAEGWEKRMNRPPSLTAETPLGTLHRLAPPVKMSKTPGLWDDPLLVPRGSLHPEWRTS